jgi:hypothetical protein
MMRLRRAVEACPASKYGVSPAVVLLALVQSGAETTLHKLSIPHATAHPWLLFVLGLELRQLSSATDMLLVVPLLPVGASLVFPARNAAAVCRCTSYPKSCHGLFFLKNQASSLALRGPYAISIYLLHLFVLFVRHESTSCCLLPLLSRRHIFGTLISMSASLSEQTSQMRHV